MEASVLAQRLLALQGGSIMVVGDVMLDRFVDGTVSRLSPEAPVPILEKAMDSIMPGGAANVAINLARLGCDVRLLSVTGGDAAGLQLGQLLGSNLAIDFHQVVDNARPTTTKTRFRADKQQVLRVDEEITTPIDGSTATQLVSSFADSLPGVKLVVLSDYAKGAVPPDVITQIKTLTSKAAIPLVTDPKLADFSVYAGSDMLTPNLSELRMAATLTGDDLEDIAAAASELAKSYELGSILVTLSARGMLLARADGKWDHDPTRAREVFDVSGAGDTVIAMIAAALASGVTQAEAVQLANIAAGVVVGKAGTATVSPGEIIAMAGPATPDLDVTGLAKTCEAWRAQGDRIGFANGCFDLLHPGHMHLLETAARSCDRLIVGLNSDASVKRLKGDSRPIQNARQRAAVMSSLPLVDGVAVFAEDTPLELITALQPDIIFKGGDYRPEDVVGGDIAAARGGEVIIIPTLGNHSSSSLIED
ncbi:MAG: bifunctional heptose 7-phosphate kinase/heptose 1-phosphate adenyltransferase [SAR116 cluster bacterium]|nr:bifunctional heptose 7-phosphate kinase/heptose 1-phosphate adenyltransferase [SAR116 cluster bacterium]RPG99920.1 MAG: bifunctional heptose 7-phosphate kinase/heptose 1-phosphate adenyltransferase [Candidatus Puniceispirillum sp. TMED176]